MNAFSNDLEIYYLFDMKLPNYCFPNFLLKQEVGGTYNFMLSY